MSDLTKAEKDKISRNEQEDKAFADAIERFKSGKMRSSDVIKVGTTPYALRIAGAGIMPLTVKQTVIANALATDENQVSNQVKKKHTEIHKIPKEILGVLPKALRNPLVVAKGKHDNSMIVITDLDFPEKGKIYVSIELDRNGLRGKVNAISTISPRKNPDGLITDLIKNGQLIAMHKKEADHRRTDNLAIPQESLELICYDDSIAYTDKNVKTLGEVLTEISQAKANKNKGEITMPEQEQMLKKPEEEKKIDLDEKKPTSFEKSGKLMPILEAKAEFHQGRIDTIDEKVARREDKITRNEAKIDKLRSKAEKLEDLNVTLKTLVGSNPLVRGLIERNERKISEIRNTRIPKREAKIEAHKDKITALQDKRKIIEHKLDRTVALSKTITSFALFGKERRQNFRAAMDELHRSTIQCLNDKISALETKMLEIGDNAPSAGMDGLKARRRMNELSEKINKLKSKVTAYETLDDKKTDKLMEHTAETITETIEKQGEDVSLAEIAENAAVESAVYTEKSLGLNADREALLAQRKELQSELEANQEVLDLPLGNDIKEMAKNEIAELQAKLTEIDSKIAAMPEYMQNSTDHEKQNEPATDRQISTLSRHGFGTETKLRAENWTIFEASNVIKAISNNGWYTPDEIHQSKDKADILAAAFNYLKNAEQSIEGNTNMIDGIINNGADDHEIAGVYDDVERAADEQSQTVVSNTEPKQIISAEQALSELESTGRTNPDFYKELPREDRSVSQSLPMNDAKKVITALAAQNVAFSAVVRKTGMVAIATDKKDSQALDNEIAKVTGMQKAAAAVDTHTPRSENIIHTESPAHAKKIVQALSNKGISCKAQERSGKYGDFVSITVPKAYEQAYKQAEAAVKAEKAEYINPDFYKHLPPPERFTQRMDADKAVAASAKLTEQGVEQSAVIDGSHSAVTVATKDKSKLSFVGKMRGNVKKRIQSYAKEHKEEQPQPNKGKGKGNGLGD